MGVIQITDSVGSSGIGKFSRTLHAASSEYSEMYYFRITRKSGRACDWARVCNGIYLPFGSSWYVNTKFRDITFHTHLMEIRKRAEKGDFIHYTSHVVKPIREIRYATVTIHDFLYKEFPENYDNGFVRSIEENIRSYRKIEYINCFSKTISKDIESSGFNGKIDIIPHPLFEEFVPMNNKIEIRKELGLPVNKKIVLSVSSAERRKNLRVVKESAEKLGDEYIILRVGPGIGTGLTYDNVDGNTLIKLYNSADVLLMPSLFEGFGIPLIEALSCELPIVASDLEIFHEIAENNAIYVEPRNVDDVVMGIREAAAGFKVDPKFSAKVRRDHSFENFSKSISNYYRKIGAI